VHYVRYATSSACLTYILFYVIAPFCAIDFITTEEEARLLEDIEGDHAAPWESDLTRRVKVLERLHQMYIPTPHCITLT
jgi:hypothetical protein